MTIKEYSYGREVNQFVIPDGVFTGANSQCGRRTIRYVEQMYGTQKLISLLKEIDPRIQEHAVPGQDPAVGIYNRASIDELKSFLYNILEIRRMRELLGEQQ